MPTSGFSIKALKVKLLAGEQKATELGLQRHPFIWQSSHASCFRTGHWPSKRRGGTFLEGLGHQKWALALFWLTPKKGTFKKAQPPQLQKQNARRPKNSISAHVYGELTDSGVQQAPLSKGLFVISVFRCWKYSEVAEGCRTEGPCMAVRSSCVCFGMF